MFTLFCSKFPCFGDIICRNVCNLVTRGHKTVPSLQCNELDAICSKNQKVTIFNNNLKEKKVILWIFSGMKMHHMQLTNITTQPSGMPLTFASCQSVKVLFPPKVIRADSVLSCMKLLTTMLADVFVLITKWIFGNSHQNNLDGKTALRGRGKHINLTWCCAANLILFFKAQTLHISHRILHLIIFFDKKYFSSYYRTSNQWLAVLKGTVCSSYTGVKSVYVKPDIFHFSVVSFVWFQIQCGNVLRKKNKDCSYSNANTLGCSASLGYHNCFQHGN